MAALPSIELRHGSLTEGQETVLINSSNTNVQLGSGVSAAIRKACGAGYQKAITDALHARFKGPMAPGQVLVTDAGADPHASFVIHVAVMDYRKGLGAGSAPTLDVVRTGLAHTWEAVEELPGTARHSVAMVAVGAGNGNLGVVEPTRLALETLEAHVKRRHATRIERVAFYGYLPHEALAMARVLVDAHPALLERVPADVRRELARKR